MSECHIECVVYIDDVVFFVNTTPRTYTEDRGVSIGDRRVSVEDSRVSIEDRGESADERVTVVYPPTNA